MRGASGSHSGIRLEGLGFFPFACDGEGFGVGARGHGGRGHGGSGGAGRGVQMGVELSMIRASESQGSFSGLR